MAETTPTEFSELFAALPAELKLRTFLQCSPIDLVCLSLVSRSWRALVLPYVPPKPALDMVEQLAPAPKCWQCHSSGKGNGAGEKSTKCALDDCGRGNTVRYDAARHRWRRHHIQTPGYTYFGVYDPDHAACQVTGCKNHCVCISCPLFTRLRGWMGDLRYCRSCVKFTRRFKKYNKACMHGRPKRRKSANNHWTRTKNGLSWGRRWWSKWGTCNLYQTHEGSAKQPFNARVV